MGPILQTDRLLLRPFKLTDAERVQVLANDKEVARTTLSIPHPYTMEGAKSWLEIQPHLIRRGDAYPLAIVTAGEIIGTVVLRVDKQHCKGELAYYIGRDYWRRGYATEAVKRMVTFGFEELQLNRLWAPVMHKNKASAAVLQKAGFQYEGTLKQDIYKWGQYEDVDVFGIMRNKGNHAT